MEAVENIVNGTTTSEVDAGESTDDVSDSTSEDSFSEELPLPDNTATPKQKSVPNKRRQVIISDSEEGIPDGQPIQKAQKRKKKAGHQTRRRSNDNLVLLEIQKSNKLLATLVKRVENNEKGLKIKLVLVLVRHLPEERK